MAFVAAVAKRSGNVRGIKRPSTPYLLLIPGIAWLFMFFIYPLINLASTSTQTPAASGEVGAYVKTFRFANYIDAFLELGINSFVPLCTRLSLLS